MVLVSLTLVGLSAREPDPAAESADRHQNVSAEVRRAGRGPVRRTGSVWRRCSWVGRVLPAARRIDARPFLHRKVHVRRQLKRMAGQPAYSAS